MSHVYAYYPGCTLHSTAKEYDVSARLVCDKLGIELHELEDWTCCGASSAHFIDRLLGLALPARQLKSAEDMDLPLVVACAMCFSRFKVASHELSDSKTLQTITEITGQEFRNAVNTFHLLEVMDQLGDSILVTKPLKGLRVACYYGCLLARPKEIMNFDDEENPQIMDRIVQRLGAEVVNWDFKTECCGASLLFAKPEIVVRLSHQILYRAKQAGADCIAVACPMCHSNLDTRQKEIKDTYKDMDELPVLYFTQLIGLALGFSTKQLLVDKHFTAPLPMLKDRSIV